MGIKLDVFVLLAVALPFAFILAAVITSGVWWFAGVLAPNGDEMAQLAVAAVLLMMLAEAVR